MTSSGTPGFLRFAENLKRIRTMESELAQETAVRREEFRASLVPHQGPAPNNLSAVFAYFRGRISGK